MADVVEDIDIPVLQTVVYLTLDDTIVLKTYLDNIENVMKNVKNDADGKNGHKTPDMGYTLIFVADKEYIENNLEDMIPTLEIYFEKILCESVLFLSPKATQNYIARGVKKHTIEVQNKIPLSKNAKRSLGSSFISGKKKFPIDITKPGFNIFFKGYNGQSKATSAKYYKMRSYHVKIEGNNNNIVVKENTIMSKLSAVKDGFFGKKNTTEGNTATEGEGPATAEGGKTRKHRKRKMCSSKRKANKKGRKSRKKKSSSKKKK